MTAWRSVFFAFQVHPSMLGLPPFTFDLLSLSSAPEASQTAAWLHLVSSQTSDHVSHFLSHHFHWKPTEQLTHSLACFLETSSRRWNLARLAVYPLPRCRAVDLLHNFCKITSAHSLLSVVGVCAVSSPYVFCGLCWDFSFVLHSVVSRDEQYGKEKKTHIWSSFHTITFFIGVANKLRNKHYNMQTVYLKKKKNNLPTHSAINVNKIFRVAKILNFITKFIVVCI